MTHRCKWAEKATELDQYYHDTEWGKPNFDDIYLFEMLNLEGQQAGLSWTTILNKRETMREAYAGFIPKDVLDIDVEALLLNPGIIRHRLKIEAVIANAKAFLALEETGQSFSDYIWSFVDNTPIVNHYEEMGDVPASTDLSVMISKDLKKKGFKFVGPTTVYAFMQAVGMVNDHTLDCDFR